jgi:NAD dependent epimerase/dehydratase family enzyme
MSWISLTDLCRVILFAIDNPMVQGAVNAVAPNPVTNLEFTKALGRALSRPTIFPLPAFAARLALGEMADELLLASTRVEPAKLQAAGFKFIVPSLADEGWLRAA